MTQELRRLLIDPPRLSAAGRQGGADSAAEGPVLRLEPAESHYLRRVLRLRQGDRLAVIDGRGRLWTAVCDGAGRLRFEQPLGAPLVEVAPMDDPLTLALAVPRRDADLAWRMATELGADVLQPLLAHRCVRREGVPLERWRSILREATEQCERLWEPRLEPLRPAGEWLAARPRGLALIAATRRPGLPPPEELLALHQAEPLAPVTLAIGPEGGWTPEEEGLAEAAGWRAVSLGDPILRSSTAAVAGIARLAAARQRLSCPSFPSPCP